MRKYRYPSKSKAKVRSTSLENLVPKVAKASVSTRVPNPGPYTAAVAKRWAERAINDFWYNHQMPFTWQIVTHLVDISQKNRRREHWSDDIYRKLGLHIDAIETRAVIFPVHKKGTGKHNAPYVLRIDPPQGYPIIRKLSVLGTWSLFARCVSCSGNKFLPVIIAARQHVACYQCLPPDQYKSIGAQLLPYSLIEEEARKYY